MIAAHVLVHHRTELICDLAEVYHIIGYRGLPATTLAAFVVGLRPDSRVGMAMNGTKIPTRDLVQIAILDNLTWLRWSRTKDGSKGRKAPKPLLDLFLGEAETEKPTGYSTAEGFERQRQKLLEEVSCQS